MKPAADKFPSRARRSRLWLAGILVVLIAAGIVLWQRSAPEQRAARPSPPIPVTTAEAAPKDVPIFLDALGTVQAWNTVAVRSQVDGKLEQVRFKEGQEVRRGDVLAVIDQRPFKATLDQAVAKKAEDEAQLVAAGKDLTRFKDLAGKGFGTQQSVDQQQGKYDQLKATIDADQGAIENAQTQLSYATIMAPIDGLVGFRQVDIGNIVHANDPNPLTVLTQIRPVAAVFTLPQKNLAEVREAMLRDTVQVSAIDQDTDAPLADGELLLIDNQIDQTTSTIRLKARFANDDDRLWPGEFVRVRAQVDIRKDAVTVPSVAVQRGPQGYYTWVIKPDNTAEQRPIEAKPVDDKLTIITSGLAAGERVVVNGQSRLQPGSRVDAKPQGDANVAQKSP